MEKISWNKFHGIRGLVTAHIIAYPFPNYYASTATEQASLAQITCMQFCQKSTGGLAYCIHL